MRRMKSVFVPGILEGQVAFVTGGGSGIGAGIAKKLAAFGAKVALAGRTVERLDTVATEIRATGGDARTFAVDVRQYPAVEAAVKGTVDAFGRLDIVINSAAGNFLAPAAALSANGFRTVIDIDLCGTYLVAPALSQDPSRDGGYHEQLVQPRLRLMLGYRLASHFGLFAGVAALGQIRAELGWDRVTASVGPEIFGGIEL